MKIAVAMSGGVDSSTAAYILKAAGHDVVGLSMQMYDNLAAAETTYGGCCTLDDLADAHRVAWKLDIPHFTLNLERNFHEKVITPFVQSYLSGTTPSPCVLCNTHVKFDLFHQKAQAIGPILQGMAKPVHVLQRGVDVNDIVNMAAIAVVDAQEAERVTF